MEYCALKGFLVVLIIQGLMTSIQSSSEGTHYGRTSPQEPELTSAGVAPAVLSPPSLKEVQQAVQEASEQVEGRRAEEVLKQLLEKVVEVALGRADGGSDAKVDPGTVQKAAEEEADFEAEVLEQKVEDENMGISEEDAGVEEKQDEAGVDASEDVSDRGVVNEKHETVAGSVEKTTAGVETGVREADTVRVIDETLGTEFSDEVVEGVGATLDETGEDSAVMEKIQEDNKDQAVLSEEKGATLTEIQETKETLDVEEVAVHREPELNLGEADVEQIGDEEETQLDKTAGETIALLSDSYQIEATQTAVREPVLEEEDVNIAKEPDGPEEKQEQGHLVEEGASVEVELGGTTVGEAKVDDRDGESVIKGESEVLVNKRDGQKEAEEEQLASETSIDTTKKDQDVVGISGPEPDDGAETTILQSPENQASTADLFLIDVETEERNLDDEKFNGNEIINPTNDLFPYDSADAHPTLDNFMNDDLAKHPRTEGETLGETNELVKDPESTGLGLEPWKIGVVTAAVFLVLQTAVIIIYIVKRCHKNKIAAVDPANMSSTLAKINDQQGDEHAIAMSGLPPSSTDEWANIGPGPNSSQDLRTSFL
ncbi:uncharacterized protein si:dkeyp-118a3.2 isoform X2 [Oreochromis niloticus]|uniref:uncharacterized protein si:dkeyp-118a3.2 isoform X2 n=1 Tax=Oreochromis niloticus TaxID=8128 RepID=UPI000DF1C9FD|nr:uncharacterized protein LOC102076620 isoform X2 [Oreochromis niloticus]